MEEDKISVITVVYNDVKHIKETIESFLSQTWQNKEYIIIDGGSTDGTVEIIKHYSNQITFWCSEKDNGIYDAMNKGIKHCKGDWINILNCGDVYVDKDSLKKAMNIDNKKEIDVIYGDSIRVVKGDKITILANEDTSQLEYRPIYRHGSSLIRTKIQKKFMYDINKKKTLGYSLDWEMIHRVYEAGYKFKKVNCFIEEYKLDGISYQPYKSLWYNYKITNNGKHKLKKLKTLSKTFLKLYISKSKLYKYSVAFVDEYTVNDIIPHLPIWKLRKLFLSKIGLKIGKKSFIMKRCYIKFPRRITIGDYTDINRDCFLDGRGYVTIGDNVSISYNVKIITGGHDINSKNFNAKYLPIVIKDYAWLGIGCTILQGVTIGKGAVVCAGAVVTHNVNDYEVVGGIPARHIKNRSNDLNYHCIWDSPFT